MRTNIELDDDLITRGISLTGAKTKRQLVHLALEELVRSRTRRNMLDLAGEIELEGGFDHRVLRRRRG
ncbi:MAG TPA: type II toxin-antitoxin system VapB family antitoxin [Thermoanaerobaculia bacterium]|nr:type II toxin-antitoxin system VapB family antitoxin [Thermoanaerobaculia bacterium]